MTIIQSQGHQLPEKARDARGARGSLSEGNSSQHEGVKSSAQPESTKESLPKKSAGQPAKDTEANLSKGLSGRSSVLSAKETSSDLKSDSTLRPDNLDEYIGQTRLKSMLTMSITAAKRRNEPIDH